MNVAGDTKRDNDLCPLTTRDNKNMTAEPTQQRAISEFQWQQTAIDQRHQHQHDQHKQDRLTTLVRHLMAVCLTQAWNNNCFATAREVQPCSMAVEYGQGYQRPAQLFSSMRKEHKKMCEKLTRSERFYKHSHTLWILVTVVGSGPSRAKMRLLHAPWTTGVTGKSLRVKMPCGVFRLLGNFDSPPTPPTTTTQHMSLIQRAKAGQCRRATSFHPLWSNKATTELSRVQCTDPEDPSQMKELNSSPRRKHGQTSHNWTKNKPPSSQCWTIGAVL